MNHEWDELIAQATTVMERMQEAQNYGRLDDLDAYRLDDLKVFLANVGVTV